MLRVRMDFKTLKKLDEICEQEKVKRSEMTRILIEKEYDNLKKIMEETTFLESNNSQKQALTQNKNCSQIGGAMKKRALNVMIPVDMYEKIKEESQKLDISMASMIRIIINKYFEK